MTKSKITTAMALASSAVLIMAFQNCSKKADSLKAVGSTSASSTGDDSSNTDTGTHQALTTQSTLDVYQSTTMVGDATSLVQNMSYTIKLDLDNLTASAVTWSANSGVAGFANCTVTGTDMIQRTLMCSSVGKAHIGAQVTYTDGTSEAKIFERTVSATTVTPPASNIITFSIKPGTGTQPWNTAATPITAYVGQTVHFVNDDSIVHRLHTSGSPCPHEPTNIANGGSYDCVLKAPKAVTAMTMYDHNIGTKAIVYMQVLAGPPPAATP